MKDFDNYTSASAATPLQAEYINNALRREWNENDGRCPYCGVNAQCVHWDGIGWLRDKKKREFLVIKCLNCGMYLIDNDKDSQIDCPFCGYSNELTDIRIDWWEVVEKDKE